MFCNFNVAAFKLSVANKLIYAVGKDPVAASPDALVTDEVPELTSCTVAPEPASRSLVLRADAVAVGCLAETRKVPTALDPVALAR